MTTTELLDKLRRLGIHVSTNDDKLVVDAPAGVLSPELADAIRKHKTELLKLFAEVSATAADTSFQLTTASNEHRLSLTQERIWAIDQLSPGNGQFNLPGSWWLTGPLDVTRFETALNRLVDAHHIFKRRFETREGKAVVTAPIHSGLDFTLMSMDDIASANAQDQDLAAWLADISREPFDLAREPLLRVFLVAVENERHYLALISHAAIWDAWCYDLFLNELGRLYEQDASDQAAPAHQFADYVRWQRDRQESESVVATLQKETSRLKGIQHRVRLPLDYPDPDPADHSGARYNFFLTPDLRQRVKEAARQAGATPFMVLLTSYATLLCRYTGQETVLVTVPLRGREKRQFEQIFGPFTNNLFLRVNVHNQTFSSLLGDIKTDIGEAFGREIAPFERLIEELDQDLAASAFFQLQFSFQNVEDRQPDWATGIKLTAGPHRDFHATHADISFWLREGRDSIDGAIDYRTAMFDEATIVRFYQRFLKLTEDGVKSPDTPLSELLNEEDEGSRYRGKTVDAPDTLLALTVALRAQGDSAVVYSTADRSLLASELLALLEEDELAPTDQMDARLKRVTDSIDSIFDHQADSDCNACQQLASQRRSRIDLAVAAWAARLKDDENRVLIADPKPTPSTIIAWLAVLTAGKVLCLPGGDQAADEVSVCHLIGEFDADVVFLSSPLMQALLSQEDLCTSSRYIVRALRGAGSVVELCVDRGIKLQLVLADEATLGIGLTGSGKQWPHLFEHVEKGASACVQDRLGKPQLTGVDGSLALALGDDSLHCIAPATTARQMATGQFCWPDNDVDDGHELEQLNSTLLSSDGIVDAHVAWRGNDSLSKRAIAWVVQEYKSEITSTELRTRLSSNGIAPLLIINVDEIPRGRSGQVLDRDLPHPDITTVYAGFEPPASDREKEFAAIWRQVLELERIGAHDTFAKLGGNSVQALVVLSETQKQMGWSFEPRLLFFQSLRQIVAREPVDTNGKLI